MFLWIGIGILLLLIEVLTMTFFIIFFAIAALSIAAILIFYSLSLPLQILAFAMLALTYCLLFRKILKSKKSKTTLSFFENDLIGKTAAVIEPITEHHSGKILVGDTLWQARASHPIEKGTIVKIIAQNNLTLEVQCL